MMPERTPTPAAKRQRLPIEALERVGEAVYGAEDDPLTRQYRATMGG